MTMKRNERRTSSALATRTRMLGMENLESRCLLDAKLVITEFSAANDNGIRDEDGDRSDWIEIHNAGDEAAELNGWFLTDDSEQLDKWRLPPASLGPGAYQIIFASNKDRTDSSNSWHTNFRLDSSEGFLALVEPDGRTIASGFAPAYPVQIDDYSFGIPQEVVTTTVLRAGAASTLFIPSDDSLGMDWTAPDFDDSRWMEAATGVGFGQSSGFPELVATDIKLDMIRARNSSAYLRVPFTAEMTELVTSLELRMKYDDGFVAYLNGVEIARRNAPDELAYNSDASEAHPNADAIVFEPIDLTEFKSLLVEGRNILAIHGMNLRFTDTDFLVVPEIEMVLGGALQIDSHHYFPDATPGQPNGTGVTTIVSDLSHTPSLPDFNQGLTVVAAVTSISAEPESVNLRYRVMYDAEVDVPMFDDGLHGDGAAGDGTYAATIPSGVASAGEMIRYYVNVQENAGDAFRWPNFRNPLDSEEYRGTIVRDSDVESSNLPVMHLFMENPSAARTREGTRAAIFFGDEFYDNVRIDLHGNLSARFPRKSRDIDLNRDHLLRVSEEFRRVNDVNLLTNYTDPSKMRSTLVYEAFGWAGAGAHFSFPVRTELNGAFEAIYDFVEDGDDRFLERIGRDPNGALYNMEGSLESLTGADKRSGVPGDFSGLQSLVDGLMLEGQALKTFLFDNANLPALANYLATLIITSYGDCCGKNYYIYQDTYGTGEWEAFPWDVNIGLGAFSNTFDEMRTDRPLYTGSDNRFFGTLYDDPDFSQMYLRRLRTLMDEIYGPPGSEGRFEQRIDELAAILAPDAPADELKLAPLDDRRGEAWEYYVDVLRTGFVNGRREFLYNTQTTTSGGPIPVAQPENVDLAFGQIEVSPTSGNQDDEFIQLMNPNSFAVDISGWTLDGPVNMQLKPGTVIPAGGSLYLSPNVNAFRGRTSGPSGNQGLFVQGPYVNRLPSAGGTLEIIDRSGRVSASTEFQGDPSPAEQFLRITELMYNPVGITGSGFDNNDFEFIELRNTSDSVAIDLTNVRISEGIQFDFANTSVHNLEPGEFAIVSKNRVAFEARYGTDLPFAGQYGGRLSNGGERIRLSEGGTTILDFAYRDDWYPSTDGNGTSLVVFNESATTDRWSMLDHWRASSVMGGSPGLSETRIPGDSNGDGRFDSSDLVFVFTIGEYEDGEAQNSTFEEGDWNGDGDFTTADFVFVFQANTYVAKARSRLRDFATVVDWFLASDEDSRHRANLARRDT